MRDKVLFGHLDHQRPWPPPLLVQKVRRDMLLTHSALKEKSAELKAGIADARSARNLKTRRRREDAAEEHEAERHRRRRKRKDDRELEQRLRRRVRVRVPLDERPRIGTTTAHKLYHRAVDMLRGTTGITDARGPDGLYSLHFGFVARGFSSKTGRRWRAGEAERAARYIVREDGLEDGEFGWWSNIAADRNELVAFFRAAEAVERHDRTNANVYCSEIIALPAELSARQRRRAVKRICRFYEKRGLAYVAAIHMPDEAGDQRNFHCHIIYSLRPAERHDAYDWSFGLAKDNDINTPKGIAARRRQVVRDINATLHAAGIDKRYTHLSNKARRMAAAQAKIGQDGIWASRRLAALETRAARLREIGDIARPVRETLFKSSAALAAMKAAIEDRLAEKRKEVQASMQTASAQDAALRTIVVDELERRCSIMASARTAAQSDLDRCATHIATTIDRRRRDMDQAQRAAAAQQTVIANTIRDRIGVLRAESEAAQRERARVLDGAQTGLRRALESRRAAVVAGIADARASLDRTRKRIALLEKRRAFDAIQARVAAHQVALTSARLTLIERLTAIHDEARLWAAGAHPLSSRVAEAREILVSDLPHRKEEIVAAREAGDKALTDAKAAGRKLASPGIGKARGAIQAPRGAAPASMSGIAGARPGSQSAYPGSTRPAAADRQTVAPNFASQRDSEGGREPIRPAADVTPAPPPAPVAETQPWSSANKHGQSQAESLRDQARVREAEARQRLRKAALARLSHLDIVIVIDAAGRRAVAKGGLADDEMRALMDPAFDAETQAALGRIAVARAQQAGASAQSDSQTPAASGASIPAPKKRGKDQEYLRSHVRNRTSATPMDMAPPPLTDRPPPDLEALRLLAAEMLAMRDNVRAREERVRRKLRQRTLRYLARLDPGTVLEGSGRYGVAKGVLTEDEVRVLMDSAMTEQTQATLAKVAAQQHQRALRTAAAAAQRSGSAAAEAELARQKRDQRYIADKLSKGK